MIVQMITRINKYMPNGSRVLHRLRVFALVMSALMVLGAGLFAYAQDDKPKQTGKIMKGISGEISAISKDFVAVVYRRDEVKGTEEEIALPVAKDVIVEHKKSITEIGVGDLVDVEFAEYTEETPEGPKSKRVAKVIRFIRAAPKQAESSILGIGSEGSDEPEEE